LARVALESNAIFIRDNDELTAAMRRIYAPFETNIVAGSDVCAWFKEHCGAFFSGEFAPNKIHGYPIYTDNSMPSRYFTFRSKYEDVKCRI